MITLIANLLRLNRVDEAKNVLTQAKLNDVDDFYALERLELNLLNIANDNPTQIVLDHINDLIKKNLLPAEAVNILKLP